MDYSDLFSVPESNKTNTDGFDLSNLSVSTHVVEHEPIIPEYQGDYAKAVFLWGHKKGSHEIGKDSFARYIVYECGIEEPIDFQKKMIEEGYLEEDSMAVALESLSGEKLKNIATELNVATSGRKSKVVERILGAASMDYLNNICPRTCSITEKGRSFVKEHDDYVQIHRHKVYGVDWEEYDSVKMQNPGFGFCETMEKILLKRASEDEMYLGSGYYHFLSELLYEYQKPAKATRYLLQRMYLELNGINKWRWLRNDVEYGYGDKNYFYDNFYIGEFFNRAEAEKLSQNRAFYSAEIVKKLYTWQLPIQICEQSLFEEMIEAFFNGTFDEARYESLIHDRYVKYVDTLKRKE